MCVGLPSKVTFEGLETYEVVIGNYKDPDRKQEMRAKACLAQTVTYI